MSTRTLASEPAAIGACVAWMSLPVVRCLNETMHICWCPCVHVASERHAGWLTRERHRAQQAARSPHARTSTEKLSFTTETSGRSAPRTVENSKMHSLVSLVATDRHKILPDRQHTCAGMANTNHVMLGGANVAYVHPITVTLTQAIWHFFLCAFSRSQGLQHFVAHSLIGDVGTQSITESSYLRQLRPLPSHTKVRMTHNLCQVIL